jgi:hypothetical protein
VWLRQKANRFGSGRKEAPMTARLSAAVGLLTLTWLSGCAGPTTPAPTVGTTGKTITLGATRLFPDDLTMNHDEKLSFVSTADQPLTVEFTQPKDQAGKITCRVADPKTLEKGEKPWGTFRTNSEGHLTADVPPGLFPSVCTLAPGSYVYLVHVLNEGVMPDEQRLGQQGTITVK